MAATSSGIALSRVAIWYQDTQVDLALPTRAPISDYIDDVVDTFSDQVDVEARRSGQWTLARLDRPLQPNSSLADARVADGAVLELRVVASTERYRPVIEDVVDAVAAAAAEAATPFDTAAARRAGLAALVAGGLALCAAQWRLWAVNGYSWPATLGGVVVAVVALIGMWSAATRYRAGDAAAAWSVIWIAAVGCLAQVVPVSQRTGLPGLAHLLVAAVAVGAAALCALWITGAHPAAYSATTATAAAAALLSALLQYTSLAPSSVAAGTLALGLVGLSSVPRAALTLARISLPRLPAPGQEVEVSGDISDTEMESLRIRARRAVQLTSGLMVAAVIVVTGAAVCVLDPHSYYRWLQVGIVACTVIILVLRGRTLSDRIQAYAMFAGAGVITIAAAARLLIAWPTGQGPLIVVLVVAVLTAVLVLGAVVGAARPLPETLSDWVQRLELAALAVVIPLCVWVTGAFAAIREVTFR
ncbi:type VII secretion integral membrane protein EccD [Mycobacterium avium]|uniref:type VII secretion integral membrane protein EccD n=1 Tax=Mycobacterium avium TaxID=1764 RepID=UPI000A040ABB|nr:type VII secretion integral membrane protein EccD [Mycobacterium avium]